MGFLDFLKKAFSDDWMSLDGSVNRESDGGIFSGDLADNPSSTFGSPTLPQEKNTITSVENKDSADSVVFMSFINDNKIGWTCSECGTQNSDSLSGCIVCGLEK